jgi:hypothetical protein
MNALFEPALARIVVGTVDCALRGSEYALEGWKIIRRYTLLGKTVPLDEFNRVLDLLDRAEDDVKGVHLTVDLGRGKVYEVNRPADELGDQEKAGRDLVSFDG